MSSVASARTLRPPYARQRVIGGFHKPDAKAYVYCGGPAPPAFPTRWEEYKGVGFAGQYSSMSDVVTPGYRQLIARGTIINNGMSRVDIDVSPYSGNGHEVRQVVGSFGGSPAAYRWAAYNIYGDWLSLCLGPPTDGTHGALLAKHEPPFSTQALYNQAAIQALNRVEPALAQSLVSIAESQKTIALIASRAQKLGEVLLHCRKGDTRALELMFPGRRNRKPPRKYILWDDQGRPQTGKSGKAKTRFGHPPVGPVPDKLAPSERLWLEYRYGWTPLVHEIVDLAKALYADDLRKELTQRDRYTARGTASKTGSVTSVSQTSNSYTFGTMTTTTVAEHEYTVRAYILYKRIVALAVRRLNDFGAFDLPRALWEVAPMSFVVDWFIPIGDWLQALTPKVGVEVLASGYEIVQKCTVTRTVTGWVSNPSSGNLAWNTSPVPIGSSDRVVMRSVARNPRLGNPTFPPPEVKLNLKKLVDAITLIKQGRRSSDLRI